MSTISEVDLPSGIKEVNLLTSSKEYASAVKKINQYLKLWPLEQDFYISKAFCELKLKKFHSCLATIATYHGQAYKAQSRDLNTIAVAKDHLVNGVCKWLHFEQGLAFYRLGKYNLALQALMLCKSNLSVITVTKLNLQNKNYSHYDIDDFLEVVSHLSPSEHPKYLHLLAQILFRLEQYDKAISIYNNLLSKYKDQDILTNNIIASYIMNHNLYMDRDEKYDLMESILQKYLDYNKIKTFELAFNSSLIQSFGGKVHNSINYLDMADELISKDIDFNENLNQFEIMISKAQRSYLKMFNGDIEAEDYNKIFLNYISSKPHVTNTLIKMATNILIFTKNINVKRDVLSFITLCISNGIDKLEFTKFELDLFYKNILTSMLQLGMLNEFQTLLSGLKSKYPNHNYLILFIASLYYAQNRIQKCERILLNNLILPNNQKEILALMILYYLQGKYNKVLSVYNTLNKLSGDYLHKSILFVLKSINEISNSNDKWIKDMETIATEYEKICQAQATTPSGHNLLLIAALYLKANFYDKASNIYKRILFGDAKYEPIILGQASSGLAFAESFTEDYKLWSLDCDANRLKLVTKFQQSIYEKIKFIESENLETEGIAYIHSCKMTTSEEVKKKGKPRKRSRIHKMDPATLAMGPPDPERWLPKHQRSGFKKSKKKKKEDFSAKITQGSLAPPSEPKPTTANITTTPSTQKRKKRR